MKGKRTDFMFVASFIEKCVSNNLVSTNEIINYAKSEINLIDNKIKEVEELKKTRSKLLDVIFTFENKISLPKIQDYKVLQLFNLKNKNVCKLICDQIRNGPLEIGLLIFDQYDQTDINYCIKQLIDYKIISKVGNHILQGNMYNAYMINVMCE